MNRDDRAALIDMGRQFTPCLFDGLDAGDVKDELLLEQVGKAFSHLHAVAQEAEMARAAAEESRMVKVELTPVATDEHGDPQPSPDDVEAWLQGQPLLVTRQRVQLVEQPGVRARRRVYSAYDEPASMADVLSWRLDVGTGLLHLVLCDGQVARLPWP